MHTYHSKITGWLKNSDEGQVYEEGKRNKGAGGSSPCHKSATANTVKGKFLYESRQQS